MIPLLLPYLNKIPVLASPARERSRIVFLIVRSRAGKQAKRVSVEVRLCGLSLVLWTFCNDPFLFFKNTGIKAQTLTFRVVFCCV